MPRSRILIVDDEPAVRFGVRDFLEAHGFEVLEGRSCEDAVEQLRTGSPDVCIVDYRLPDGSALDVLPRLQQVDRDVPVIILTGHGSIELAVQAIKDGAEHFLTKPLELPALLVVLQRVLENRRNQRRHLASQSGLARGRVDPFLGVSGAIRRLAEEAHRVLTSESAVLILGETGTGKGVLARWLHDNGPRAEAAFVDLNCAGLSREFLESELFGHERGAFTGAISRKPGLLEVAHHGTVFLDEIGDADVHVQPKLLKVLEEKRFRRLGDVHDRHVDIRLVTATHRDLVHHVHQGTFRHDLYYRISTLVLVIPPLRERVEDIPVLARHLLRACAVTLGRSEIDLAPEAEQLLQDYAWPGNIRELRNVLERAILLEPGPVVGPDAFRFDGLPPDDDPGTDGLTLRESERRQIERALMAEEGNVGRAARRLGIPKSTMYEKLRRFGISVSRS